MGYRLLGTAGFSYLSTVVNSGPGLEYDEVFWATAAALTALATASAGRRLWRLERTPRALPVAAAIPVPPPSSAAHEPISRLTAREHALAELVSLLGSSAREPWSEASAAAAALRRLADQLMVLESARGGVPPEAGPGLDAALAVLRLRLAEGVSAYDLVVAAAIDAVAATTEGRAEDAAALRRLSEAADSLAGLARGLREVGQLPARLR